MFYYSPHNTDFCLLMKIQTFQLPVGSHFSAFQLFVSIIFLVTFSLLYKMECSSTTFYLMNHGEQKVLLKVQPTIKALAMKNQLALMPLLNLYELPPWNTRLICLILPINDSVWAKMCNIPQNMLHWIDFNIAIKLDCQNVRNFYVNLI